MSDAQKMAQLLSTRLPRLKAGSICFWGEWFGRPNDNVHRIVSCEASSDILRIAFDQQEVLCVWSPRELQADERVFRIANAAKVRWEWFYYGRPMIEANRYFMEFANDKGVITATTNIDWFEPNLKGVASAAAVEIV